MQTLPITPLSDIAAAAEEGEFGAARIPAIDFDAMVEEFESIDADLEDANDDKTGEFAAAAVAKTAEEAATGVRKAPEGPKTWLSAADAADELEVSVRHLRRLATAGKVERKKDDGKSMYCLSPYYAAQAEKPADNPVTGAGVTPETQRAAEAEVESKVTSTTGAIEVSKVAEKPAGDEVIELDASDIVEGESTPDVVAEELVNTNRDLMRLVEGMLGRWHEVQKDQGRNHDEIREQMIQAMQLQQCLTSWQHHASALERQLLQVNHIATRALDVAEEALSTRWTSRRRQRELQERLTGLRDTVD